MAVDTKAVDAALRWTNAFPKPGPNQGVRADAALAAYRQLAPLAERIARLPVGAPKATYPGAGYLTGKTITQDDINHAKVVLIAVSPAGLPMYGRNPVDAVALGVYKAAGQHTLMVATDLAVERTLLDKAADAWGAVGGAVMDLPQTVSDAARNASEVAWRAATEPWLLRAAAREAKDQLGVGGLVTTGLLVVGGGLVLLKLLGR